MKRTIGVILCAALLLSVFAVIAEGQDKDFKKLKKDLAKAISSGDSDEIADALIEVLVQGGSDAVKVIVGIIEKLPKSEQVIYWQLVKGVCTVTDRDAMEALAEAIVTHRKDALGRDLLFALQNNRCRNAAIVHQAVLEKCGYDMQKMSIESLVNMEEDTSVDALIAALRKIKDRAVKAEIIDALRMLTRADCGTTAEDWAKWWDVSRGQGMGISKKESSSGGTGTVVDELERFRRDKMFGDENMKLKALVITDYCQPQPPWRGAGGAICFDHIEDVLRRMKVEVIVIKRPEFEKPTYKIPDDVLGVFVNCVQIHDHCICPDCSPDKQKRDRLYP